MQVAEGVSCPLDVWEASLLQSSADAHAKGAVHAWCFEALQFALETPCPLRLLVVPQAATHARWCEHTNGVLVVLQTTDAMQLMAQYTLLSSPQFPVEMELLARRVIHSGLDGRFPHIRACEWLLDGMSVWLAREWSGKTFGINYTHLQWLRDKFDVEAYHQPLYTEQLGTVELRVQYPASANPWTMTARDNDSNSIGVVSTWTTYFRTMQTTSRNALVRLARGDGEARFPIVLALGRSGTFAPGSREAAVYVRKAALVVNVLANLTGVANFKRILSRLCAAATCALPTETTQLVLSLVANTLAENAVSASADALVEEVAFDHPVELPMQGEWSSEAFDSCWIRSAEWPQLDLAFLHTKRDTLGRRARLYWTVRGSALAFEGAVVSATRQFVKRPHSERAAKTLAHNAETAIKSTTLQVRLVEVGKTERFFNMYPTAVQSSPPIRVWRSVFPLDKIVFGKRQLNQLCQISVPDLPSYLSINAQRTMQIRQGSATVGQMLETFWDHSLLFVDPDVQGVWPGRCRVHMARIMYLEQLNHPTSNVSLQMRALEGYIDDIHLGSITQDADTEFEQDQLTGNRVRNAVIFRLFFEMCMKSTVEHDVRVASFRCLGYSISIQSQMYMEKIRKCADDAQIFERQRNAGVPGASEKLKCCIEEAGQYWYIFTIILDQAHQIIEWVNKRLEEFATCESASERMTTAGCLASMGMFLPTVVHEEIREFFRHVPPSEESVRSAIEQFIDQIWRGILDLLLLPMRPVQIDQVDKRSRLMLLRALVSAWTSLQAHVPQHTNAILAVARLQFEKHSMQVALCLADCAISDQLPDASASEELYLRLEEARSWATLLSHDKEALASLESNFLPRIASLLPISVNTALFPTSNN